MTRYRFYVGLRGGKSKPDRVLTAEEVARHVAFIFHGATVIPTFGVWAGSWEPSCIIEVLDEDANPSLDKATAAARACEMARLFDQDAVLLTMEAARSHPKLYGPKGEVQP